MQRWFWAPFISVLFVLGCTPTEGNPGAGDEGTDDGGTEGEPLEHFAGLAAPVEIVMDTRGVPHVYAEDDNDLFYAGGYQMATDRLFQMDLMRRRALGRQAEVLGDRFLEQDKLSRIFNFKRWAAENVAQVREVDRELYRWLVAWIAGVNRRIEQVNSGEVPTPYGFAEAGYTPETWTLSEHSAIAKLILFGNSSSLEQELLATAVQRTFPEAFAKVSLARPAFDVATMPPNERPAASTLPPGLAGPPSPAPVPIPNSPEEIKAALEHLHAAMQHIPRTGSNNWAVHGRHTVSGRPLIAGDPHQPLESPSVMYTQHLSSIEGNGNFDVIGWAFTGGAGIHMGHNRHVHWTATTNFADVMDIWEVQDEGSRVLVGGSWIDVEAREEPIIVAGGATEQYVVRDVPGYGVILNPDIFPVQIAAPGHALVLNWTGFQATREEQAFLRMALAPDVDTYTEAVDFMDVGGFNFVSADASDISYHVNILVPDRGDPSARQMPFVVVDGDDPESLWDGTYLGIDRLPRSRALDNGWITTANNDPWGFTFDGDVSNDPWYYGYFFAAGHRAKRLEDELTRLAQRGEIDVDDMLVLQTDTHSPLADALSPVIEEAWGNVEIDEALAEFRDDEDIARLVKLLTLDWNHRMDRGQPGAAAFHLFLMLLTEEVIGDELSLFYDTVVTAQPAFTVKFPVLAVTRAYENADELMQEGQDFLVLNALRRTAGELNRRFGGVAPSGYEWSDLHGTRFSNKFGGDLEIGFVPTDGGEDTVNVSSSTFLDANGDPMDRFDSVDGAVFRVVTTFDEDGTPVSFANFPPGNSADPTSPHFRDTLDDWVAGRYTALPFRRADVDAAAESSFELDPDDHPGADVEE